jgi:hypothetical protein
MVDKKDRFMAPKTLISSKELLKGQLCISLGLRGKKDNNRTSESVLLEAPKKKVSQKTRRTRTYSVPAVF